VRRGSTIAPVSCHFQRCKASLVASSGVVCAWEFGPKTPTNINILKVFVYVVPQNVLFFNHKMHQNAFDGRAPLETRRRSLRRSSGITNAQLPPLRPGLRSGFEQKKLQARLRLFSAIFLQKNLVTDMVAEQVAIAEFGHNCITGLWDGLTEGE